MQRQDLWALNADKPWALAEAKLSLGISMWKHELRKDGSQQMFAMSFGIIDLLMHEVDAWLYGLAGSRLGASMSSVA